ncbi:hypothetical protein SAMN04488034_101170 [Salinimicrobium catena]|uniref:DUF1508 domain-containing protein n=1 Tax=Salinimicrobium catena TaxID=390640 RepID=A0A1H5HIZ1_9FLAO|nr:DUF1508 domain-containing protein [Salinimicrobium catena]SDK70366.1 hypothetical protein SAMN04488140_101170 [Salinimicrobium catena]SEE27724.1 hypothetical protein SAMN04488034_101170 [Salinimicrobium catena]
MSAFVISKRSNENFKFTFANRRGKTIFTSIACKEKSDCELIISTLQNDLESFTFRKARTGSGKYFFRITRGGLVLATSRKFSTERLLQKGIDQFMKYGLSAETLDFSENEDIFVDVDALAED